MPAMIVLGDKTDHGGEVIEAMVTERLTAMRACFVAVGVMLAGCTSTKVDTSDVDRFVQRRLMCDHFRGELPDPSDKARMDELIRKANESCAGTDAQLKALKAKYDRDAKVMTQLIKYEDQVE
jgi:hypothetical protein